MKKNVKILGYNLYLELSKSSKSIVSKQFDILEIPSPYKLNFGPGPNWERPDTSWLNVDVDPRLGDIVVNFQSFENLPLKDKTVICVYGSHVFEHISIFKSQKVFNEIYRVLMVGGYFRLVLPDVEKSIKEYIEKNHDFLLFNRRKERARKNQNIDYTLFECMREDFLSPNGQANLLGQNTLAHQNAWDFQTIKAHLTRAGFKENNIKRMSFQKSDSNHFIFEGTYSSEANEDYRSLYIEVTK